MFARTVAFSKMSVRSYSKVSPIPYLKKLPELNEKIESKKPLLVYFTAKWCGPCQRIAPIAEQWNKDYENVDFYKVDIDEASELAMEFGISSVPTFMFYKDGEYQTKTVGAVVQNVLNNIKAINE